MPQRHIKNLNVLDDGKVVEHAVIGFFEHEGDDIAEWYDVVAPDGSVINGEGFNELPTERDVEKLLAQFKRYAQQ